VQLIAGQAVPAESGLDGLDYALRESIGMTSIYDGTTYGEMQAVPLSRLVVCQLARSCRQGFPSSSP
jgi:hypothetical protein